MAHVSTGALFAFYGQLVAGGMILALGALNAVLGVSLRERVYLWYAAAMGAFTCYAFVALFAGGAWRALVLDASLAVYFGAVVAFAQTFLRVRERQPSLFWAILAAYGLLGAVQCAYLGWPHALARWGLSDALDPSASAVFLLLVFSAGIRAARAGESAARFYCVAFAGVVVGLLIGASGGYGVVPPSPLTELAPGVGVAWEALFLALALADRIRSLDARNASLEVAAFHDALTGIANRGAFEQRLDAEWRRAARARMRVAIVLIDVDHFKEFNDAYGHPRGDRALARIAAALSQAVKRPEDFVARYGGEEFAVVLPGCSREDAARIAEGFRAAVRALSIAHAGSPLGFVTISLGVASALARHDLRSRSVVAAADRALYAAKREGRNRVALARSRSAPRAGQAS